MPRDTAQNRRAFALHDVKALDDTAGTFSGYLACFGNEDLGGDVIEPGAFAKTLQEARERKAQRNNAYLFPILYQHDERQPCGGFQEAHEDNHGLYVKGQLDLDTQLGRDTYSGLKKGYLSGMSIGYSTTKQKWVGDVRHLQELALFEGSIVTFPMNTEAQVSAVKAATGKADWPLGDRGAAWDAGAAHKRIVKWATTDGGDVDVAKMKSVHFYSPDGDAAQNISEYKLLFCDVVSGSVKAMPRGIMACWGSHGVDNTESIPADEKAAIHKKLSAYAARMRKAFDDDSIMPPWDAGKSAEHAPQRKAMDFNTALTQLSAADALQDEWGDSFQALVNALYGVMLLGDTGDTSGQDAADTILQQFSAAMSDLVGRSLAAQFVPCLDDDGDSFYDPDGPNADDGCDDDDDDDDGMMHGWMSADLAAEVQAFRTRKQAGRDGKAGRTISADNHAMMSQAVDMIGQGHKALSQFLAMHKPSPNDPANPGDMPPTHSDNVYDPGFGKSQSQRRPSLYHYANARAGVRAGRSQATTAKGAPPQAAGVLSDTTAQATTHSGRDMTPDEDVARFRALMADIRQSRPQEHAPVAG